MVKEANTAVSTQQTSQDNPLADFGPNEWIVEDMYQRYLADPASVDAAWHDFFADYKPALDTTTSPAAAAPPAPSGNGAPAAAPPKAAPAPAPAKAPAPPRGGRRQGGEARHSRADRREDGNAARCRRPHRGQHGP